jgi:O-antigen/teichoic acid export membrane protein
MLFLETLSSQAKRHRLVAGIGANLIAELARAVMLPLIAIAAARYLGSEGYGIFATGQALQSFAAIFGGFGLLYAILQLGSRGDEDLPVLLSNGIVGAMATALVAYGGLAAWVYVFDYSHLTRVVVLLMGTALFPMAFNVQLGAALQVQGRYTAIAIGGVVAAVANVIYALAVVLGDLGIEMLALSPLIASAAMSLFTGWLLRREFSLRISLRRVRSLFGTGFLFGVGDLLYFIYLSIDLVMLSLLVGAEQVGLYNIPVRVLVVAYLLPIVVFNRVLYARYFDWSQTDPDRLRRTYVLTSKGILFIGMLAATALVLLADPLVPLIFGESFQDSALLLRILALALPLRYLSGSASAVLATNDKIGTRVRIQAATAALNLALCFILLPTLEARGASIETVITEAFLLVAQIAYVRWQVLDTDLVKEARLWLFAVPFAALSVATLGPEQPLVFAIASIVAVGSLAVIAGPLKYFEGLSLPQITHPAETEHAGLAQP